ncbi:hypothetical protein [Microbacterium faecale]|uniref:hypothetical protein n=1 Tax=Microbacterium faecale TaxID=1804630 RepID=UPI001669EE30|nr:hypothetical protein [Microbacterium faecale]
MVRFNSVLNVSDLIRDAILFLLQQVDRYRTRVVGLQQLHPFVVEPVPFACESREFFCLVRHEQVEVCVDLSSEVLPHPG